MTKRRDELAAGDVVGPYRIDAPLGRGGMGQVFRATREDGSVVALKVLRADLAKDRGLDRRFRHEARAAGAVEHKHVVRLLDVGEADGRRYIAMQLVDGETLGERLKREGPLRVDDLVAVASGVAAGLDAIHAAGVVHRDLKPPNIMLDERRSAAITDFGLSRGVDFTRLTRAGHVVGTLDYLAPELFRGADPAPTSDIYALGCIVYECITGAPPFASREMADLARCHIEDPPPDPSGARADLPPGFAGAALQALEKDPERRPPTGTAYARMLFVALRGTRGDPRHPAR
jgi:serine/threonine kinase PknH